MSGSLGWPTCAMREAYPSRLALRTERILGSGDLWVAENVITYDGTTSMHTVNVMEFHDGKMARETIYFGDPWEPLAWWAQSVALVEPATVRNAQEFADSAS